MMTTSPSESLVMSVRTSYVRTYEYDKSFMMFMYN